MAYFGGFFSGSSRNAMLLAHWCAGMEQRRTSMTESERNYYTPLRCERWK
jgi:hypothetical protein